MNWKRQRNNLPQINEALMKKIFLLLSMLVPTICFAQSYSIDWYKISGGGGTSTGGPATGTNYSVSGTIGQHDASGAMSSGQYSVTGGFWSLIQVVQTPGAPTLIITHVGSQAIVSWDPLATGWTLQTNNNLSTGTWGNYLGAVNNNSVTNAPSTGNVFFRLKQ